MLLELHILQNFAPSNLNRDDTGSPKTCEFGGYRRARISSQAIKRSIRRAPNFGETIGASGGVRTRRLALELACRLEGLPRESTPPKDLLDGILDVFKAGGLEPDARKGQEGNSKVIVFMAESAIIELVELLRPRVSELVAKKTAARDELMKAVGEVLVASARCPDVALFGRMLEVGDATPFGRLNLGIVAASQVAHAISTHEVSPQFDYFTAVEELNPSTATGAAMLDTAEFNSACYYRYANVDLAQLTTNLGGDEELVEATVRAFLLASRDAIPTGKQNSFAARNAPSFFMTVVRPSGAWSLANAFVEPVRPDRTSGLVVKSMQALGVHWRELSRVYGDPGGFRGYIALATEAPIDGLGTPSGTFAELLESTLAAVRGS